MLQVLAAASILALATAGAATAQDIEPNPLRDAYLGNLHDHTARSFGAYINRLLRRRLHARDPRQHGDGRGRRLPGQEARLQSPRPADVAAHYHAWPVACTPASGREKGQVGNQVARSGRASSRRG